MNKEYIEHIRKNSAYPTLRTFLSLMSVIAALLGIGVIIAGFNLENRGSILISIIVAVILFFSIKIAIEAALTLADSADATMERAARDWIRSPEIVAKKADAGVSKASDGARVVNGTITCAKCNQANFVGTERCVGCKGELPTL